MDMSATSQDRNLGDLPEWDLRVFYEGVDDPRIEADLAALCKDVPAFANAYRGKLNELAGEVTGGDEIAAAIARYEALEDRMGRIASYAGLLFAMSSTVPEHARFYGDMQTALTELNSDLLFFGLELNALADEDIERLADSSDSFRRYLPWEIGRAHV